jgi:hypothetical protein
LKDPVIINEIFLKKPERIEALGLIFSGKTILKMRDERVAVTGRHSGIKDNLFPNRCSR